MSSLMWLAVFRQRAESAEEVDGGVRVCACRCVSVCVYERQSQRDFMSPPDLENFMSFSIRPKCWFFGQATVYFSVHYIYMCVCVCVCVRARACVRAWVCLCVSACWLVAGRS